MILIADSGSTKTDWVLVNGHNQHRFKTMGYNPYFISTEGIQKSLAEELIPALKEIRVEGVYFYGAGCSNPENVDIVMQALTRCFQRSKVEVGHDMLAAARALLGNEKGFAAILGTGSNTCLYNGRDIIQNIDSLGYMLGDEGSGSYIGKKIVRDYLRGYLPPDLRRAFVQKYDNLQPAAVFDAIYNQPLPNRYLAGFCLFAHEHGEDPYIQKIVSDSFNDFFVNLVAKYPHYQQYSFNCVGSVAAIFKNILTETAEKNKMKVGRIIHSPITDLVAYHLDNLV